MSLDNLLKKIEKAVQKRKVSVVVLQNGDNPIGDRVNAGLLSSPSFKSQVKYYESAWDRVALIEELERANGTIYLINDVPAVYNRTFFRRLGVKASIFNIENLREAYARESL